MDSDDKGKENEKPDIKLEVTNGKHLEIDFDAREWIIIMLGVCTFAWITGLVL